MSMKEPKDVGTYVENAPEAVRAKLRAVRAAITKAAPHAVESMSYGMPFYSFVGESGFDARLCYFGLLRERLAFYSRPRYIDAFRDETARYRSTKSALHFPLDRPMPIALIQKIVRNGVALHAARRSPARSPAAR